MGCFCNSDDLKREAETLDKTRRSTDKFWLVLFIICWIVLMVASIWSFTSGHPNRILQGYDSFGNICGQKNKQIKGVNWSGIDMTDKPYVFHMLPSNTSYTMKVCVKQCAEKDFNSDADISMFYSRTHSALFRYDYSLSNAESYYTESINRRDLIPLRAKDESQGFGPLPHLPVKKQRPVLNRCVSTDRIKLGNSVINNAYNYLKNMDIAHKLVSDIDKTSRQLWMAVLFGILIACLVTFTIHYLASIVSFVIMVLSSLILIGLTCFSWFVYYDLRYKLNAIPSIEQIDDDLINEKTFLIFSIIMTIISVVILVITFYMKERLGLMVALFDETASCLRSIPALIFQPIWTCAVLLIFLFLWTTVFMAIATTEDEIVYNSTTTRFKLSLPARSVIEYNGGNVKFGPKADTYHLESVKHTQPIYIKYLLVFLIVMLFWSSEFILGCQQMTVASSVASWYFTRDKSTLTCPIGKSILRTTKYHLGSISLGSFLIVLFKIPRLILAFLEYQMKQYKDKNTCVNCAFKCCHCFWYCMENFIRYINHNAYTIIAIEGRPYCFSAKVAFNTLTSNTLRILTINTMGDFIIFLGKCVVTGSVAIFSIYLMRDVAEVHYLAGPVIFSTIIAYLIAHSMLCVYEMVIDTMFLCFVEDIKKNTQSPEGYFASESLLKFAQDDIAELKAGPPMITKEMNVTSQPQSQNNGSSNPGKPDSHKIGFVYPNLVESSH